MYRTETLLAFLSACEKEVRSFGRTTPHLGALVVGAGMSKRDLNAMGR